MALDELVPLPIAELDRLLRRADDVREEHRRQHAVDLGLLPGSLLPDTAQELRDRLDRLIRVDERSMVVPRQLDQLCAGNTLGHVATVLDRDGIVDPVNEQRRQADDRQHVPDVDLHVHPMELADRRRACALPLEPRPPVDVRLVAGVARRHPADRPLHGFPRAELPLTNGDALQPLLTWR